MPYQPKEQLSTRKQSLRPKPIAKNNRKLKTKPTYDTPEKQYVDQNTMSDTPSANEPSQRSAQSLALVLDCIKQLNSICRYGKDTLYVCLQLLNRLKIQIQQDKCKLYAAALFQMAAKVHEFRTPRFADLVAWGNYIFSRDELIVLQWRILLHFDFKIPTALNFQSIKQAQEAIKKLQSKIQQSRSFYKFQ